MANKFRGEVTVKLDRERVLKFDTNALASFETEYGRPAMAVIYDCFAKLSGGGGNLLRIGTALGFREVRALLWAALLHEDEGLTIRQAGVLIDQAPGSALMERLGYVMGPVMQAFQATMPEVSKKNAQEVMDTLPSDVREILEAAESSTTGASSNASRASVD